jgi:hypothetical protein
MLGAECLWAGRDLYCVTPAVKRGLFFVVLIEGPMYLVAFLDKGEPKTYSKWDTLGVLEVFMNVI